MKLINTGTSYGGQANRTDLAEMLMPTSKRPRIASALTRASIMALRALVASSVLAQG